MRIHSLLTIFCFFCSAPLFASDVRDSIGIENHEGKEVVLHRVEMKETYYSLSRRYHVTVKSIIDFNASKALQPGMTVKVPTERPFGTGASTGSKADTQNTVSPAGGQAELTVYEVGPKETLFAIARKFGTTVGELRELNNLKSNSLSIGQKLKVRQRAGVQPTPAQTPVAEPPAPQRSVQQPAPTPAVHPDSSAATANIDDNNLKESRYGLRQHEDRGVAIWIEDENVDPSKMLALHNTLPAGTILKVTNPMNGKSTFVKVIGKYTENESTKDVVIVFTKAVADTIGAIDKRFQVTFTY